MRSISAPHFEFLWWTAFSGVDDCARAFRRIPFVLGNVFVVELLGIVRVLPHCWKESCLQVASCQSVVGGHVGGNLLGYIFLKYPCVIQSPPDTPVTASSIHQVWTELQVPKFTARHPELLPIALQALLRIAHRYALALEECDDGVGGHSSQLRLCLDFSYPRHPCSIHRKILPRSTFKIVLEVMGRRGDGAGGRRPWVSLCSKHIPMTVRPLVVCAVRFA